MLNRLSRYVEGPPVGVPIHADLAPSDFYCSDRWHTDLLNKHFRTFEEVKEWFDEWIAAKDKQFYKAGFHVTDLV